MTGEDRTGDAKDLETRTNIRAVKVYSDFLINPKQKHRLVKPQRRKTGHHEMGEMPNGR